MNGPTNATPVRAAAGVAACPGGGQSSPMEHVDGPIAPLGAYVRYLTRQDVDDMFGTSGDAVRKWQERYADGGEYMPFPRPDMIHGGKPGWSPQREPEIRAWHEAKPTRGAGGGRPRKCQPE